MVMNGIKYEEPCVSLAFLFLSIMGACGFKLYLLFLSFFQNGSIVYFQNKDIDLAFCNCIFDKCHMLLRKTKGLLCDLCIFM